MSGRRRFRWSRAAWVEEAPRSPEQVREHYEIEKELAARLLASTAEERKHLYRNLYDEMYRRVPHHPQLTRKASLAETEFMISEQLDFLARLIDRDTTYLEVGPGDCALTFEMSRRVRKAIGVDVSAEVTSSDRRRDNLELILSDGVSIPVPPGSIDVAYSNQLMEHLHPDDARAQLLNLVRALKPGGIYVCVTPNRFTGPHDVSRGFDPVATGFHLREYTNTELIELLRESGFGRVRLYSSIRGYTFRVPARAVLALERWLGRQPLQQARAFLERSRLGRLLNRCRVVAVKPGAARPTVQ